MAKGQAKKSREARKPKKEKVKTNASNPSVKPGSIKGLKPDTPERLRIAEIDRLLAQHHSKASQPPVEREENSAS